MNFILCYLLKCLDAKPYCTNSDFVIKTGIKQDFRERGLTNIEAVIR